MLLSVRVAELLLLVNKSLPPLNSLSVRKFRQKLELSKKFRPCLQQPSLTCCLCVLYLICSSVNDDDDDDVDDDGGNI
jgi:hypothetical protein